MKQHQNNALRGWLALGLALALTGCAREADDLDRWMQSEIEKPGEALDPIPATPVYDQFTYQAHDQRDPFLPLKQELSEEVITQGPRPDTNRIREPLEEYPLDALKMVGTIGSGEARVALVMDPGKVTHRIGVGRYLGRQEGRVVGVSEDGISLIQLVADGRGGWEEQPATLQLTQGK